MNYNTSLNFFFYRPIISIIVILNFESRFLFQSVIESINNQHYEHWELCIIIHNSLIDYVNRTLKDIMIKTDRIKLIQLSDKNRIVDRYNEALNISNGDYICFLKPGDEIAPFAFYEITKLLNEHHDLQIIYSDEDTIDKNGKRTNPFFKPDWSPDHFLSQDFISHFYLIRKTLALSVGGFRSGFEGSEHYDLLLRSTEKLIPEKIAHIPKVLYHKRISGFLKSIVVPKQNQNLSEQISAKKALEDALVRRNMNATVLNGIFPRTYRIRYVIDGLPKITIIIPNKDNVNILKRCINSIFKKTDYKNYEILIVDNQSIENATFTYYESLKQHPQIKIFHYDNSFNFSKINNYAVSKIDSPYVLFLNNDTEVITSEWLSAMMEHAQRSTVGAVGGKLIYPNNRIQHAGIILGMKGHSNQSGSAGHAHKHLLNKDPGYFSNPHIIRNYSAVTAACLLIRRDLFREIGGFNEDLAIAFNDVDLCLKIRKKGFYIVYTPYAQLFHHESYSRGLEDTKEKLERFEKEKEILRHYWSEVIDRGDPFYNINLSLIGDFSHNIREIE